MECRTVVHNFVKNEKIPILIMLCQIERFTVLLYTVVKISPLTSCGRKDCPSMSKIEVLTPAMSRMVMARSMFSTGS